MKQKILTYVSKGAKQVSIKKRAIYVPAGGISALDDLRKKDPAEYKSLVREAAQELERKAESFLYHRAMFENDSNRVILSEPEWEIFRRFKTENREPPCDWCKVDAHVHADGCAMEFWSEFSPKLQEQVSALKFHESLRFKVSRVKDDFLFEFPVGLGRKWDRERTNLGILIPNNFQSAKELKGFWISEVVRLRDMHSMLPEKSCLGPISGLFFEVKIEAVSISDYLEKAVLYLTA